MAARGGTHVSQFRRRRRHGGTRAHLRDRRTGRVRRSIIRCASRRWAKARRWHTTTSWAAGRDSELLDVAFDAAELARRSPIDPSSPCRPVHTPPAAILSGPALFSSQSVQPRKRIRRDFPPPDIAGAASASSRRIVTLPAATTTSAFRAARLTLITGNRARRSIRQRNSHHRPPASPCRHSGRPRRRSLHRPSRCKCSRRRRWPARSMSALDQWIAGAVQPAAAALVSPAGRRDQANLGLFVPRHERQSERAYFRARLRQRARRRRIRSRRRP